jgi:hypothetical protein
MVVVLKLSLQANFLNSFLFDLLANRIERRTLCSCLFCIERDLCGGALGGHHTPNSSATERCLGLRFAVIDPSTIAESIDLSLATAARCIICCNLLTFHKHIIVLQAYEIQSWVSTVNRLQPNLHRETNEFNKGYQPITNFVREENGNLPTDSHIFLNN